ncbi:hypothetical protein CARUB_v10018821mg [Capsella rubella]|uniref:Uncharacterized protein n=1 Tax=Capsella rubella TaxID=81985 RepID=R0H843_9BRAS|nr:uncharacterized protein LOC17887122 [Capsella rubella]EOA25474.1 hypothetical protein CARUB_v10018821mg [Capsella rubella]
MGNFLRRSCAVHPANSGVDGGRGREVEEPLRQRRSSTIRIKVRMRRDKLEELLNLARRGDQSNDSGKIGFLILKECMEGRLPASVLGSSDDVPSQRCGNYLVSRRLGSITEE